MNRRTRLIRWFAALSLIALISVLLGFHFAVQTLKAEVEKALGEQSHVGSISIGWHSVEISDLRIPAPQGWPTDDALRAAKISVVPNLRSLLSGNIHIAQIDVDGAYLSIWRTSKGKIRLLPSLLEKPAESSAPDNTSKPEAGKSSTKVNIDQIRFHEGTLTFTDDSVPREVREDISNLNIAIDQLNLPALEDPTEFHLAGTVHGLHHDGSVSIDGKATLATHESDVTLSLKAVDLLPLAPYLLKASETGIKQGSLDLDINSSIKSNHLHAPGHIVLRNLNLDTHGGFMGVSQSAAVALLKDHNGEISAHFTLDGNLSDPHFSLNESLLQRSGAGIADAMGVSIEGLTKHVSNTAESIGSKIKGLFHK